MTYYCNYCNKGFDYKNQLYQHISDKNHSINNKNDKDNNSNKLLKKKLICGCYVTDWTRCTCGYYLHEQMLRRGYNPD